jgi:hypothetical protein
MTEVETVNELRNNELLEKLSKLTSDFTKNAKEEAEKFGVSLDVLVKFQVKN